MKKRPFQFLLIFFLLFALNIDTKATDKFDTSQNGSISVSMTYESTTVSGGSLILYQIGEIDENNDLVFCPNFNEFQHGSIDLSSSDLIERLENYISTHQLSGITKTIGSDGRVVFSDLKLGVYLIVQNHAADGYETISSFLVSVPMLENGIYKYDVDASPKVKLEKEPEFPNTPPSEPTLPQTGQLNWPIPVLTITGLSLFTIGWLLIFKKKGKNI